MHLSDDFDTDHDFAAAGELAQRGEYRCTGCGFCLKLTESSTPLPHCSTCQGKEWEILAVCHTKITLNARQK